MKRYAYMGKTKTMSFKYNPRVEMSMLLTNRWCM